jgi:hypothetical protein
MPSLGDTLTKRIRAPFMKSAGLLRTRFSRDGWDNDFIQRAETANGGSQIDLVGTDALNNALLGGAVVKPFATPIHYNVTLNTKISTAPIMATLTADKTPLEIVRIDCVFETTNGAALTGYISKEGNGQAVGAGASVMSGTFNLNATARTVQNATLVSTARVGGTVIINPGEQLSLKLSTTVTSLAGLVITVWVRPHTGAAIAQYSRAANGDIATATMYLNLIPGQVIRGVTMRWGTAGTDGGAVTGDITKDTGTNAPGAGTSILAAALSLKTTANTTMSPALAASAATLTMAAGDRLAFKLTGTPTALANLVVTVFFSSSAQDYIVVPVSLWDSQGNVRYAFIADQHYQVADAWETWSVASTSRTHLLTKDTGTTGAGGGTGLQTDNTNTGILTSATANTPVGSLLLSAVSTKPTLWLAPGDRLGINQTTGTLGSLAGAFYTILLRRV